MKVTLEESLGGGKSHVATVHQSDTSTAEDTARLCWRAMLGAGFRETSIREAFLALAQALGAPLDDEDEPEM